MQSVKRNISSTPTSVLYIPQLPPLLASWSTLKTHFSQYGDVRSVVLNPQHRSATVSFVSPADAEFAKSEGCVWKNKEFQALYCSDSVVLLDPRATSDSTLGYSELETLWSDDDIEEFGVAEAKSPLQRLSDSSVIKKDRIKRNVSEGSESKNVAVKTKSCEVKISKSKSSSEKKSPKTSRLRSSIEKKSPTLKSANERKVKMALYSVKEKQKEARRKVKEAAIELNKKKRLGITKELEDGSAVRSASSTPTLSLKEKFKELEERDKLIRKSLVKSSDVMTAKAVVGTCPDMCPEKERIMREYRRLVSIFEMVPGSQRMDHSIAVKAYVRSSADQEEPLPHELRPEPVLSMTMNYLITKIMPLIDDPQVNISEWYDFCWDRLRGIRKDVIQQRLCSLETVTIIEQCARFHICCYDYFWGADPSLFDEKINTENLMNCLQTLRHMYEDLGKEGIRCPREAEFNAYMILLNMKTGDLMGTYQLFSETLQRQERIQTAVRLYLMFNNGMYSQFFKLVKNSTYLDTCLLQRYFYHVRVQALQAIARAYCPPNKSGSIPLKQLKNILKFDSAEDTELFCEGHGIMLKENQRDFSLYRNDFCLPDNKITSTQSSSLVTDKRLSLVQAVTGDGQYVSSLENHRIHSSFSDAESRGTLSEQQSKLSTPLFTLMDSEVTEELIDPDEEMAEITPVRYYKFDKQVDSNKRREITQKETFPMDMDDSENIGLEKHKHFITEANYSKTELERNDNYMPVNSDAVSRKHSDSSAFRFDLKSAKIETAKGVQQQSVPFSFGSVGTNIFGTKNQVISDKLKQNQFSLKIDFTQKPMEDIQSPKQDYYSDASASQPFEGLADQPSCNINEAVGDNSTTGKNKHSFTFTLGTKSDNLCFVKTNDRLDVDIESSKSSKPQSVNNTDAERCKRYMEHIDEVSKENRPLVQLGGERTYATAFRRTSSEGNFIDVGVVENRMASKDRNYIEEKQAENKRKLREKEEKVLNQLKKDLRRRLKSVTARHFIRKWKQKVDRIKTNRKEFPLLISTPLDQHETVWGTPVNVKLFTNGTLLNRLKVKQQNLESVDLILHKGLRNIVTYVGKEIAENIALNNDLKLELRDFRVPYYWKLVVSVPFPEDSFFTKKFYDWLCKLFYSSNNPQLGSVTEEKTLQNVSVYYCIQLVTGNDFIEQKDKLNGMNSLIFFNIAGVENSRDKSKRLKNLLLSNKCVKPINAAIVNIGKPVDSSRVQLVNVMNGKVKSCKVTKWMEEYWSGFESVTKVVKFLTSNIDLSNDIRVCTLYTVFARTSEHMLNVLDSVKIVSKELSSAILNPNFVIDFYNVFFTEIEKLIIDSNLRDYYIVPPEFKDLVYYLNKPGQECSSDVSFSKTRRPNILKAFSRIKLPAIKPWPPHDATELLDTLDGYCDYIGCNNILPRLIRAIDLNDDIDISGNLNKVSWVNFVDLIVRWLLETSSEDNRKIVVIYDERDISTLYKIDFSFKLLYNNLGNF